MNKETLSLVIDERPTTMQRLRVVAVRRVEELLIVVLSHMASR